MQTVLHRSGTRGVAQHGWLQSFHSFSFASYYNPERMGFGALRVINDDTIEPGTGFGTHPHNNMEIISIPLSGSLRHRDTMGNDFVIRQGEVQVMSAGSGIAHSEYNNSSEEHANFLQIWVIPNRENVGPRYQQKEFSLAERKNRFQLLISPDGRDGSLEIYQQTFFSLSQLEKGKTLRYNIQEEGSGVYAFLIDGAVAINGQQLRSKDALGLEGVKELDLEASEESEILLIEVPMMK